MSKHSEHATPRPWADMGADYVAAMERAEALVPTLRERATQAEGERTLPADTERLLHQAGLFRIMQPRRLGGAELDYVSLIDAGDILARGDASVAWVVSNLASHHWMLAMWPKAAQDRIWGENPDSLIASSFVFPAGKAKRASGGYTLSGRWPFSSGVTPSGWNMLAGMVAGADGAPPEHRVFLVPASDYTLIDTWDALGLKGTGSHDVAIEDAFVPEHMTVPVSAIAGGPTPGSEVNPAPVFQIPVFALFPYVLSGPAAGNAQACDRRLRHRDGQPQRHLQRRAAQRAAIAADQGGGGLGAGGRGAADHAQRLYRGAEGCGGRTCARHAAEDPLSARRGVRRHALHRSGGYGVRIERRARALHGGRDPAPVP